MLYFVPPFPGVLTLFLLLASVFTIVQCRKLLMDGWMDTSLLSRIFVEQISIFLFEFVMV